MGCDNTSRRFYELVWPHAPTVLRVARILSHCDADAEDLSQETMLKAFKGIHTLRDSSGVKPWLLSILRHCHIDRARTRKPDVSYDAAEIQFEAPPQPSGSGSTDPDELLESFSDEQMIRALRRLPEEIRCTVLLVDIEGLPDADAAGLLNVPVGTVKSRLHRGRRMLYRSLLPVAKELRLAI